MEPLKLDSALQAFSVYPVYELFADKLDYLKTKKQAVSEAETAAALKAQQDAEKLAQDLQELDKEMSKIIGQELESRKLDRHQPQSSEVHLPLSGLLQKKSAGGNTINNTKTPSILLKKKKKSVLKSLGSQQ